MMGDQMNLFAYARNADPETSHQAANSVDANALEERALLVLRTEGNLNTKEMSELTGIHVNSLSPRMKPLEEKGLVRRTNERRGGCIVWEACE